MTQGRQREAWNHTASLLALLANVNRDPRKGRAFKPADFHPFNASTTKRQRGIPLDKGNIQLLKTVFVDGTR